jgi:cellobiose epimerase
MLEASEALGRRDDPKTERMAKMLVDHALAYGWDTEHGGFYREGTTFGRVEDTNREWWIQVEGLNALLLMHEKYGRTTDAYFKAFEKQWRFFRDYQIDAEQRGVFEMVATDGKPVSLAKAKMWKAAYHDGRALMNVTDRLRRMAGGEGK